MSDIPTLTVAVRCSDGGIFHENKTRKSVLIKLAGGSKNKWRVIIQQMKKHKKTCKVRLIVGYKNGNFQYEEMIYRHVGG